MNSVFAFVCLKNTNKLFLALLLQFAKFAGVIQDVDALARHGIERHLQLPSSPVNTIDEEANKQ